MQGEPVNKKKIVQPNRFMWCFVVAEVDELGVTEDTARGPFSEFDFSNDFGSKKG
jgi:hypothetical protein